MTPINAIASVPPGSPGLESGAARNVRQAAPDEPSANASDKERSFWDRLWGKDGFSFGALLDAINPLQHIPVVSTIYRAATGDTIGPAPRIMGGALFGGVIGLITSVADAVVEGVTGKDTGSHVMAMLPDPDPVPQWATDDDRRHRATMTAVLNLPGDVPTTQFADNKADKAPSASEAVAAAAPAAATQAALPGAARGAMPAQSVPDAAAQATHAAKTTPVAAALQHSAAVIPASAQQFATPPARAAQAGAGGNVVPLANNGRPVTKLPSAKELAANPALLQGMRQGGAAAANTPQPKSTGRIDTGIKGHGLLAPGAARPAPMATPASFDTMPAAGDAPETSVPKAAPTKPVMPAPAARDTSSIPEVSPDFLMKMQQALDKYQSMRAPPTVDVAR